MTLADETTKPFAIGTIGWTADDLDDPRTARRWDEGHYEIIEGVLTEMPPAQFDSSPALLRLLFILQQHVDEEKLGGSFGVEVDFVLGERRVVVADAMYLSRDDKNRQASLYAEMPNRETDVRFGRIVIPATLVIESVSRGHESHDRETKRGWYAEAGVPNYWIFDYWKRSVECLFLVGGTYETDQVARNDDSLAPRLFPKLKVDLSALWG